MLALMPCDEAGAISAAACEIDELIIINDIYVYLYIFEYNHFYLNLA